LLKNSIIDLILGNGKLWISISALFFFSSTWSRAIENW
jgi:hypothetical protein